MDGWPCGNISFIRTSKWRICLCFRTLKLAYLGGWGGGGGDAKIDHKLAKHSLQ